MVPFFEQVQYLGLDKIKQSKEVKDESKKAGNSRESSVNFCFYVFPMDGGTTAKEESLENLYASVAIQRITPPAEGLDFTLKNLEGSLMTTGLINIFLGLYWIIIR